MTEESLTISQICAKGKENLKKMGVDWVYPAGRKMGPSVRANRRYLDSLFFEPRFFEPVAVDTTLTIFGLKLKTPIFCSAISRPPYMPETGLVDIAKGVANAGSLMMLGIGGSAELQNVIDTGVPAVKIVKPYRRTELIYKKVRDAESRGCVAVGMDIDHFYGVLRGDRVERTELFGPQHTLELKQLISQARLPFIIKGVLSVSDALKAVELGATAVVVSNHGSASFDFSVPSMTTLPKIVDSVGSKLTVLVDTGFETGNDVFKALALGAEAAGFVSSMILALFADGSKGVELLIEQITAELSRTLAAAGCPDLSAPMRSMLIEMPLIREQVS